MAEITHAIIIRQPYLNVGQEMSRKQWCQCGAR
jgi:hypothetical protein